MKRTYLLIAIAFLVTTSGLAASSRESIVVDATWLKAHLQDPNLVLLHVGDKKEYEANHIPGARLAAQQDVSVSEHTPKTGLMLEMPAA